MNTRRWLRALALAILYVLLACGDNVPTEPAGPMEPAFYRNFTPTGIESRITITNYDGSTEWHYRIDTDRAGVLADDSVATRQVEHTVTCAEIGRPNGLTTVTWFAEIDGRDATVSARLNC